MVLPGQHCRLELGPNQTLQMIDFAVRRPWENANSICDKGLKTVGLSSQSNPILVSHTLYA